jgi:hypothetical protein
VRKIITQTGGRGGWVRGYGAVMPIAPDDKSWTWVLQRPCPDCGFDAAGVDVTRTGDRVRANADAWPPLLAHPHVRLRPTDDQWSALEYACHVRDVYRIFDERLRLMLETDQPHFQNWDQDVTAVEQRYDQQDPAVVGDELLAAAAVHADRWDTVQPGDWGRRSFRSDGSEFTVDSFARYLLHDPIHHLDDVVRGNQILADGALD